MTNQIDRRLVELGIQLPVAPQPLGSYRAVVQAGSFLFLSGQLPIKDGALRYKGRVGAELTLEEGRAAAEMTALNVLAQIRHFLGGFDRLRQVARLEGYVASTADFYEQPKVLDGASDLLSRVLGDRAGHARSAFAVAHLPANATIELVVTAEVA